MSSYRKDLVSYEDSDGDSSDSKGNERRRSDRTERRIYLRDRSRSPIRRRSRSSERSPRRDSKKEDWKSQTPTNTIMVTGLAPFSTETDMRNNILITGLVPKDIRLIRKRETGAPRGFAFVEFSTVQDAQRWMEERQGSFRIDDRHRVSLQYSIRSHGAPSSSYGSDGQKSDSEYGKSSDWVCSKCTAQNFKRRDNCFKCSSEREHVEIPADLYKEISAHPTNVVMLRSLDTLVIEEDIIAKLAAMPEVSGLSIKSARIGRDPLSRVHKGTCYLEMNNVMDAMKLHTALTASPLVFYRKTALVSYCRLEQTTADLKQDAQALYSTGVQQTMHTTQVMAPGYDPNLAYSASQIHSMAEYSAASYAQTPEEYTYYYQYYYQYYAQAQQEVKNPSSSAAVAIQQGQAASTSTAVIPVASGNYIVKGVHVAPDVSRLLYEESSGFYYDPVTALYYDSSSQYYYNDRKQEYLYWDQTQKKYVPVAPSAKETTSQETKEEKKKEEDKQLAAKKIQKDMDKWAKKQRKEASRQTVVQQAAVLPATEADAQKQTSGTADAAFAIMEKKEKSSFLDVMRIYAAKVEEEKKKDKSGSEDEAGVSDPHTDYQKKACLLCKRQFPTLDALQKHQEKSDLHKQNLDKWIANNPGFRKAAPVVEDNYRDRARERRDKFGDDDAPQPNKYKEKYLAAVEAGPEQPARPISNDNVGNRLLQKMGWQAGMGLGKTNQGRVDIIQADRRSQSAGLGTKNYGVTGSESYRDAVRKVARERFMELQE